MINKLNYRFMLRPDTDATAGGKFIYLYANVNGKKCFISAGVVVLVKYWNAADQVVKSGAANQRTINNKLTQIKGQINGLINRADASGKMINVSDLKGILKDGGLNDDFLNFIDREIKNLHLTAGTISIYQSRLNDLKKFRNEIKFSELSPALWYAYENHLTEKNNNSQKTIYNAFIVLNKFINRAVELELLQVNPLKKIKVKNPKGNRQFLTEAELSRVEKFYFETENKKFKKALRPFLFSCFTGLRSSDIRNIQGLNISDGCISMKIKKTGQTDRILLNDQAKNLLPSKIPTGKIFSMYKVWNLNKKLSDIFAELKINKKITFHCGRHTFATRSLELSGNIALVSSWLGHADIQTTQIYAKILDGAKSGLMDQWNQSNKDRINADLNKKG